EGIEGQVDGCYFLNQPLAGDFQITVTIQSKPTGHHAWTKAGLMLRESLDPGARNVYLFATRSFGLRFQRRPIANQDTDGMEVIPPADFKLPITMRLTRRGNTIIPEYSTDGGRRFRPAGDPYHFDQPLPTTLCAGLAITSHDV